LFERLDNEFTKRNGSKALDILVNNAGNSGWIGRDTESTRLARMCCFTVLLLMASTSFAFCTREWIMNGTYRDAVAP
jgi:hypothetical protein